MTDSSETTVLIVEDEDELAAVYTDILSDRYTVRTATSGEQALETADESIDVVLLDRRMPEMSGDEVLSALRGRCLDCQVAMLTAVEPEQDIVDMPFDDYKLKPVSQSDLVGLIESLRKRSTYDDLSQQYFSLLSKKAALEIAGNAQGEEYDALCEQLEELRAELDTLLDTVGAEAAFQGLSNSHA